MLDARTSGQIQDILHVLKKRRWQIVLPALFLLTLGAALAVIVPKKYHVDARLEVKPSRVEGDRFLQNPSAHAPVREVDNAPDHIRSYARVKTLIELQSKSGLWPEWVPASTEEKNKILESTLENLQVKVVSRGGKNAATFVDVSYNDTNPERALAFLRESCERWLRDVSDQDLERLRAEQKALEEQVQEANKAYAEVSRQFSDNAKQIDRDPTEILQGGTGRNGISADPVAQDLNARKQERGKLELDLGAARSQLAELERYYQEEPRTRPDFVETSGNDLSKEILKFEAKKAQLEKALSKITRANSNYDRIQDDLQRLEVEIKKLAAREVEVTQREIEVPNERKTELYGMVQDKESEVRALESTTALIVERINELEEEYAERNNTYRVLEALKTELDLKREEFVKLTRELYSKESAVRALEEDAGRPITFSKPPTPSSPATTPNPILILIVSVFVGAGLGLGFAVLSEFGPNSYRTVSDLANVMTVPVLGAIEPIVTRAEIRQVQLRRAMVGLSTALLIGGLAWVTWMYYASPDRLPVEIQDAIDNFRLALR